MELVPSSCNRLAAPSRTASSSVGRKGKRGLVCVFSSGRANCNVERKDVMEGRIRRRAALALMLASPALTVAFSVHGKTKSMNPYDERRLLEQNKKIQEANRAPDDFPNFIREGRNLSSTCFMAAWDPLQPLHREMDTNAAPRAQDVFSITTIGQISRVRKYHQCLNDMWVQVSHVILIYDGFQVKVVTSDNYITRDSGLMYEDIKVGTGNSPKDGQQIVFHYVGYNEAGRRIDSTYIQGSPAKIRLGNKTLVPGFEEGIRDMKPGGKRRIIIPPELGPPVGPSTFFSAKQFEVFDVELLAVQDCQRRTIAFYSDVVCS